jgi:uncharacterized protein (DUF1800 family)
MLIRKLLERISYGLTEESLKEAEELGYEAYVKAQLSPEEGDDARTKSLLEGYRIPVKFHKKGKKVETKWNFEYLKADIPKLWEIAKNKKNLAGPEKRRPGSELVLANWLRAVYSKWQLRELLVDFWHNHFNVSMDANEAIAILLPHYDRTVIRKNALGNFRVFLEDVAKHPAMLYYLDNALSKASPANENYARELFELHTLGAKHYLNHLYNRWREVPGAEAGKPEGYIDEDVYEAARAFTGWTVADGRSDDKGGKLPDTGEFYYFEGWHDNYQKRVLGVEFAPNQAPLVDGKKVLDLVAYHPATAQHICYKICQRFVEDEPPKALVDEAAVLWIKLKEDPQQIRKVLEYILLHKSFKASLGLKVKRPPELIFSYIRALGADFNPNQHLFWMFSQMGYQYFSWPTPTGHPATADYWLNSNMLLGRWNMMTTLLDDWHKLLEFDFENLDLKGKSCRQIVEYWTNRFLGEVPSSPTVERMTQFLAAGGVGDEPPFGDERDVRHRFYQMIALLGMSPEFQYC